jgi:hypothetical protein
MRSNHVIETDAMPARLAYALAGAAHRERLCNVGDAEACLRKSGS